MISSNKFKNQNYYLIFFLTVIIFIVGVIRDIDLNGDNSDDKLTMYAYAISQNLDKANKETIINNIRETASKKCSLKYECVNRLEMQINQNNNYPIVSFLINYFDKRLQNDKGDLVKISKSIHYGLLTSQFLFFSIFLVYAFNTTKNIQVSLIAFLIFIIILDKKILNINLLGFLPYWNSISVSITDHMPRGIALFSGILCFVFFYFKKTKESIFFLGISCLYHLTFGLTLSILIFLFFVFDLIVKFSGYSKKKIIKIFFIFLSIITILLNKLGFFLLIVPCFLLCKNFKDFRSSNLIISFLLSILILMFIFTFGNLLNKIVVMEQHYVYLLNIFNFFNFDYLISLFSYENIKNFNESYFMYYLRHAPTRFYPLVIPSLMIILIIENLRFINKNLYYFKKKVLQEIKSFNFIILIIIFCLSPIIFERLFYISYVYKNIQNDLVIGMKKEGTYSLLEQIDNFNSDQEYLDLIDFRNQEILSFYLLSQLYKNKQ